MPHRAANVQNSCFHLTVLSQLSLMKERDGNWIILLVTVGKKASHNYTESNRISAPSLITIICKYECATFKNNGKEKFI